MFYVVHHVLFWASRQKGGTANSAKDRKGSDGRSWEAMPWDRDGRKLPEGVHGVVNESAGDGFGVDDAVEKAGAVFEVF